MTTQGSRWPVPPLRGGWYLSAELSCLALGLALALSTRRLLEPGSAVAVLVVVAVSGWALALGLRRSAVPPVLGEVLHLLAGAAVLLWVVAPQSRIGPLPGVGSVGALAGAVREDFSVFNDDIAPLVPRTGHMVVLASLVWVLALFCSTTAMRVRAPVQAAVPHVVAMVALGFVARDEARGSATVLMLAAVGFYALAQQGWRNAGLRWQPLRSHGLRNPAAGGIVILLVAAALTAAVAPLSPVSSDPVLDLRRGGLGDGGPRTVVSPFVEVGSNLGARTDDLLFTARSTQPGYWRLTSLEEYDASEGIWVLSNSYSPVRGPLAEEPAAGTYDTEVSIDGLGGIWVPTPRSPIDVDAPFELNWDESSGSVISRSGDLSAGDDLSFRADASPLEGTELADAPAGEGSPELLDDSGAPASLRETAAGLAAGRGAYESALALQQYFRDGFTYDETVDFSSSDDALETFLEDRRGFCQQFSTAFALAARSIGLPARVVVGFTPGDAVADADAATFEVRGRHAHAWPEVRFEGLGWVPFEPTPGRGDPSTTGVTGVEAAQAPPPDPTDPGATGSAEGQATETTSTTSPDDLASGGADPAEPSSEVNAGGAPALEGTSNTRWWVVAGIVALLAASVLLIRRRTTSKEVRRAAADPVSGAWGRCERLLADRGLRSRDTETPSEFAHRVLESISVPSVLRLAQLESARRWSGRPTGPVEAEEAAALEAAVRREIEAEGHNSLARDPVTV